MITRELRPPARWIIGALFDPANYLLVNQYFLGTVHLQDTIVLRDGSIYYGNLSRRMVKEPVLTALLHHDVLVPLYGPTIHPCKGLEHYTEFIINPLLMELRCMRFVDYTRDLSVDAITKTTDRFNLLSQQLQPCMLHFFSERDRLYMPLQVAHVQMVSIAQLPNRYYSLSLQLDPKLVQHAISDPIRTIVCTPILELSYTEALALADRFCLAYHLRTFTVYTPQGVQRTEAKNAFTR